MSQPSSNVQAVLPTWVESSLLTGMLRGIERESLRMRSDGFLAQTDHPQGVGAALTHPHITTDYSEALMEFITPPKESIPEALNYLQNIHHIVAAHLDEDESLWPLSMPCKLEEDEHSIRLAQYGTSNIGQFKTLYRRGLGVRYGRRMQTIAGIHYNLSFPDALFEQLQQNETDESLKTLSLQAYRSDRYFGLIRNFIRLTPLVTFLVGASPAVHPSFMIGRDHFMLPLLKGTLFLPYATALRMGNFGYQNSAQKKLGIHYNNMSAYLDGLQKAVKTPYARFSRLGLDDADGQAIQINDHVLQIENEYYSLVRPKQVPQDGETPSEALANRGVGYVELRAVDVNPYSPIGIDENTAAFLEVLALYCLLIESPEISTDEQTQIEQNQAEVVNRGRAPNAQILWADETHALNDWAVDLLLKMQEMAALLDQHYMTNLYQQALMTMQQRIADPEENLSAQVINDMLHYGGAVDFGYAMALQHRQVYSQHEISAEQQQYFADLAQTSLEKQKELEEDTKISFEQYLKKFR